MHPQAKPRSQNCRAVQHAAAVPARVDASHIALDLRVLPARLADVEVGQAGAEQAVEVGLFLRQACVRRRDEHELHIRSSDGPAGP